ncbi:hypothetical protein [Kitasatospora griseola]|uniref:hypothetical protein n=1 Tax=Kitasatospora griseola TaxID=2064 RepID=UPI0019C5D9ED|nr:hypothetical protein [Kitasatospora griseola]GGQ55136.1 hypothetical protein GCM10010195_08460 [Kitasatospora griseola]
MRVTARRTAAVLLLTVPLTGGTGHAGAATGPDRPPVTMTRSPAAVPGEYIVRVKPAFSPETVLQQLGVRPLFTYGTALRGFAAPLTPLQLRTAQDLPAVEAIEENARISVGPLPHRTGPRSPSGTGGRRSPSEAPRPG